MAKQAIQWKELFAIVLGVAMFGLRVAGMHLAMHIDNESICHCINNAKSKDPTIMCVIRSLYYYTAIYKINYKAFHLYTHENYIADALSRLNMDLFFFQSAQKLTM